MRLRNNTILFSAERILMASSSDSFVSPRARDSCIEGTPTMSRVAGAASVIRTELTTIVPPRMV